MIRICFLIGVLFIFGCSEQKNEVSEQEHKSPGTDTVETSVTVKKVKEVIEVEKLTPKEKLEILLNAKEKNPRQKTFNEVINFLDAGDTFAYLNFEEDKQELALDYKNILDTLTAETETSADDFDNLAGFIHVFTSLGFWEPDAVGLSHFRINDKYIRNKFCIHLKHTGSEQYFWKCYGKPAKFSILDILPENTLFSAGFRIDKQAIIDMMSFIYLQMPRMNTSKEEMASFKESATAVKKLNEYLGDEVGIAVYKGKEIHKVKSVDFPSVTGCIYFKVKENITLKDLSEKPQMKKLVQALQSIDKVKVEIKNGYLFLFLNKESKEIMEGSSVSLAEGGHFQDIKEHLPDKFNSYSYLNPLVTDQMYDLMFEGLKQQMPSFSFVEAFFPKKNFMYSFLNVTEMKGNGIYMTGMSDGNSTAFLVVQGLMFSANTSLMFMNMDFLDAASENFEKAKKFNPEDIITAFDIDALLKKASTKKPVAKAKVFSTKDTANDMKQIRYALFEYSKANNGFFPESDGAEGLSQLVKKGLIKKASYVISDMDEEREMPTDRDFNEDQTSYLYLGADIKGTVNGYYYPLVITKPGILNDGFMVLFANKQLEYFKKGGKSLSSMLKTINGKYEFTDRQKEIIIKKVKEFQ